MTQTLSTSNRVRRSPLRPPRRPSPRGRRRRQRRRRQIGTFPLPSFLLHSVGLSRPSTYFNLQPFSHSMFSFKQRCSSAPSNCFLHSTPLLSSSSLLSSGVDKTSLYASGGGGSERVSSASRTASQAPTLPLSPSSLALSCLFFSLFHFRSKCDCSYRGRPLARSPSLPRARPLRSLEAASTTAHSFSPPSPALSLSWAKRGCTFFLPSVVGLIPDRPNVRVRPFVRPPKKAAPPSPPPPPMTYLMT